MMWQSEYSGGGGGGGGEGKEEKGRRGRWCRVEHLSQEVNVPSDKRPQSNLVNRTPVYCLTVLFETANAKPCLISSQELQESGKVQVEP